MPRFALEGPEIFCRTERDLGESESNTLIGWLESVISAIREDGQSTVASDQPERLVARTAP